jgi:hypothetical protein
MATLERSKCPVVESVLGKVSRPGVAKDTRMRVSAIFESLEVANIKDITP